MSFISQALRSAQVSEPLKTVTIEEIQDELQFEDVRMVHHQATGNTFLHLVCPDERYLSIKVGAKANNSGGSDEEQMYSLINDNVIYTGESNGNLWFTFGRKATTTPTKTVSFKELMKSGKALNATAAAVAA